MGNGELNYAAYVKQIEALFLDASKMKRAELAPLPSAAPEKILIIAPHPDDECLMGGYALRLKLEAGASVHVVPFSLGSKTERQSERDAELNAACKKLGFERVGGVASTSEQLLSILKRLKITMVFSPHEQDGHATHTKTFLACKSAVDAYAAKGAKVKLLLTEFWQSQPSPNLLIPLSAEHVTQIGEALMEHKGEIARNPYHLQLPAWYIDQVRRGSERVVGAGARGSEFVFGQLFTEIIL